MDVFARGPDFRPNEDNIVRVEARQLRKRLEEYFATEGKAEPIIITIPKGAYIAAFEPRVVPVLSIFPSETSSVREMSEAEIPVAEPLHRVGISWALLFFGTTMLFMSVAIWSLTRSREIGYTPPLGPSAVHAEPLWSDLFDNDHQTYIICADSALVLLQELTQRPVTLTEYVNRNYSSSGSSKLPAEVESLLRVLPQRQYTNISDVRLVQEILHLNHDYAGRAFVRSARNVQLIDFKNGNFILLGSRRSTPWVELFEPSMNFHFSYDAKLQRTGFSNAHPRAGEKRTYWIEGNSSEVDETYGVIAFLPNLSHNGNVLMIQGATGEGTEAAGEYITHPELLKRLLKSIHAIGQDGHLRYFEVLLKSGTIAGTPKDAEIIAFRFIPDGR
jgi:hypothetical protein